MKCIASYVDHGCRTLIKEKNMIGWPSTSLWLVGLYIGISLFFDGWALVAIGWALRKAKS